MDYQRHETAIIEPGAKIGKGTVIKQGAIIRYNATIGENCYIGPYCVIGEPGEHAEHHNGEKGFDPKGSVSIGDNCRLSERVSIQSPCNGELTAIGNNCYLMNGTHVGHDAHLADNVTAAPGTVIGGGAVIHGRATLGMNSAVHQRTEVPPGTILGMLSAFLRSCKPGPWKKVVSAGVVQGWNVIGMERAGMDNEEITDMIAKQQIIYPQ